MKISLDTNAYALLLKGDKATALLVEQAEIIYISTIVLGELLFGFKNGSYLQKNRNILSTFLDKNRVQIIQVSLETADFFSDIQLSLKKSGQPIPINDVWIAAHAMETGSILVSNDKHFEHIVGLRVV